MIDTHSHIDAEEFKEDVIQIINRAQEAGIRKIFVPAIDFNSSQRIIELCRKHPQVCYPMLGLHPEEVNDNWKQSIDNIRKLVQKERANIIAIGEVGLDYYWSREYENEQLKAFEHQICLAIEEHLPLMIHCRKAQNEMVRLLRQYEKELNGGVFHCFTGNEHEAAELLQFDKFALGIGGVLTFKKSNLPNTLSSIVPLNRIVLETDAPYMAPVPHRGKRNEPAFVKNICEKLAEVYQTTAETIDITTTKTVESIFSLS